MKTIIVITYQSGLMRYIPKDDRALEHIMIHFDTITELQEIELDEELLPRMSVLNIDKKNQA
tara:strand:+ start:144 stop:329 length:186 start_codon:yes stop_codon:yes gene_type:complete